MDSCTAGHPEVTSAIPPARETAVSQQALIGAYQAALDVATELDLERVLKRIVDLARQVVPVRYAALGVSDDDGSLTSFLTSGISDEDRIRLGPPPRGHGLLGTIIREARPLIVPDIAADERSVGFPLGHPPMQSLLGVPILIGHRRLGNLYLCDRLDSEPFDGTDLEAVSVLAAHAATAIDRARLYGELEAARHRAVEQRDQLRVILDNMLAGVLIQVPPEGRIELANAAAVDLLLGPGSASGAIPVEGRDFQLLTADGAVLLAETRPAIRALHGETVRNRQFLLQRGNEETVPVLVQASPLRNKEGAVTRAVVVFQDMTRLRQAEQLKDDFLSLVSHEFRTPLTAIHGGALLLRQQGDDLEPEIRQELLSDVATESDRLDRMLGNMLSLAAIQAGRLEPTTEPVLVAHLARQVAAEVERTAPRHRFVVEDAPAVPPAEGDPALLAQVLRNLYENAVKYAPNGGEVRTSSRRKENSIQLAVRDEGIGIALEYVNDVFGRFRRPGADPTVRGMGLGLYLSRLLVEAQGGTIRASSPGPDQGATFTVTLPIARGWSEIGSDEDNHTCANI